jgi:hypothetical protein
MVEAMGIGKATYDFEKKTLGRTKSEADARALRFTWLIKAFEALPEEKQLSAWDMIKFIVSNGWTLIKIAYYVIKLISFIKNTWRYKMSQSINTKTTDGKTNIKAIVQIGVTIICLILGFFAIDIPEAVQTEAVTALVALITLITGIFAGRNIQRGKSDA